MSAVDVVRLVELLGSRARAARWWRVRRDGSGIQLAWIPFQHEVGFAVVLAEVVVLDSLWRRAFLSEQHPGIVRIALVRKEIAVKPGLALGRVGLPLRHLAHRHVGLAAVTHLHCAARAVAHWQK